MNKTKTYSKKELNHIKKVLHKEHKEDQVIMNILFYSTLLVVTLTNILILAGILPLLIFYNPYLTSITLGTLGFIQGWIYKFLIKDIKSVLSSRVHVYSNQRQ